jgi:hypothetical protein
LRNPPQVFSAVPLNTILRDPTLSVLFGIYLTFIKYNMAKINHDFLGNPPPAPLMKLHVDPDKTLQNVGMYALPKFRPSLNPEKTTEEVVGKKTSYAVPKFGKKEVGVVPEVGIKREQPPKKFARPLWKQKPDPILPIKQPEEVVTKLTPPSWRKNIEIPEFIQELPKNLKTLSLKKITDLIDINTSQVQEVQETNILDLDHIIRNQVRKQKLECIALLTTSFEVNSGRLKTFLDRLYPTLVKRDLDFIIFLNTPTEIFGLERFMPFFNKVEVISTDIRPEEDVRVNGKNNLTYGGCSGPNILFLRSIRYCQKYNTTLCLETDCYLMNQWLDSCINYVKYSGTFLVAGAAYDGVTLQIPLHDTLMFHHLNGVAFYNTQSEYFRTLINDTEILIKKLAKEQKPTAYDYVMIKCIQYGLNENHTFWNFIYRNIVKTTLITNFSLPEDKYVPFADILLKFPDAVIIHKKD